MQARFCFIALSLSLFALAGCSGSGSSPTTDAATTQTFGGLTTRIVGTAQAPVVSAGYGALVVGVAGATISDITQSFTAPNLGNSRIAFTSNRDGFDEIYAVNADGTHIERLTNDTFSDYYPAFSRDGNKVAYASYRGNYDIWTVNPDGTGAVQLTSAPGDDNYPVWSPDGTKIAFTSNRDGNGEIYVMNADGTGQTNLTNNSFYDYAPTWSPDGTKIAFVTLRDGNYEIYTMNANGTGLTRLTNNASVFDGSPSWSPDGSKIAFQSYRDGNGEIYTMSVNGTNVSRLTNNPATEDIPSWSPDGSKIVFQTDRDGNYEIYTMNATDGSGVTRLTNKLTYDLWPSWSGFLKPRYVGTGGTLATACAGFLVGQQGQVSTSLLVFDTPTVAARVGARVTANTDIDTNSPNLAFTITTTTGMSNLKFVNTTQSSTPISPTLPAGTTSALVLFDSSTGLVTSVLPYTANRSVAKPTRKGGQATYTGSFTALFDGKGKNLAPNGVHSVTLSEKTGQLVHFE